MSCSGFVRLLLCAFPLTLAAELPSNCRTSEQASGSEYVICPTLNNAADLVVFAHGYVAPQEPLSAWESQLVIEGVSVPALVNGLGFAFAGTSYPQTGLAIKEAIPDVAALVEFYKASVGTPSHVYIVGVSEGGLVAVKLVEQTGPFSGGLALCGPIGDFRGQLNHFGDFRVIFDAFFPDVLPPSPISIPDGLIAAWETTYAPAVAAAIASNPLATSQLFSVTRTPVAPGTEAETALGVLWYNVFATNQAQMELGGQPYGNRLTWYSGSLNDWQLNRTVERFTAKHAALEEIADHYQTTGRLKMPLVTMHTTGDPIVPYWHELLYLGKVLASGRIGSYIGLPVERYGHCTFQPAELVFGFGLLVNKASGQALVNPTAVLPTDAAREQYRALERAVR